MARSPGAPSFQHAAFSSRRVTTLPSRSRSSVKMRASTGDSATHRAPRETTSNSSMQGAGGRSRRRCRVSTRASTSQSSAGQPEPVGQAVPGDGRIGVVRHEQQHGLPVRGEVVCELAFFRPMDDRNRRTDPEITCMTRTAARRRSVTRDVPPGRAGHARHRSVHDQEGWRAPPTDDRLEDVTGVKWAAIAPQPHGDADGDDDRDQRRGTEVAAGADDAAHDLGPDLRERRCHCVEDGAAR